MYSAETAVVGGFYRGEAGADLEFDKFFAAFMFPTWHEECMEPEHRYSAAWKAVFAPGKAIVMSRLLDRTSLPTLLLCSIVPVMVTGAIQILPSQIALLLATWVLASVPLGIGIGHCVSTRD